MVPSLPKIEPSCPRPSLSPHPPPPSMSFANDFAGAHKKRRIQRACDVCRKRKSENDEKPGETCAHCKMNKLSCTYGEILKSGAPSKTYVEHLENRLERMEKVLQQLCTDDTVLHKLQEALSIEDDDHDLSNIILTSVPALDTTPNSDTSRTSISNPSTTSKRILTNPLDDIAMLIRSKVTESPSAIMDTVAATIRRVGHQSPRVQSRSQYKNMYRDAAEESNDSDAQEDFEAERVVTQSLKNMHVQPPEYRFFGKSSGTTLVGIAMEAKLQAHVQAGNRDSGPAFIAGQCAQPMMKHLRPEFWIPRPWESSILPHPRSPGFAAPSSFSPPSSHSQASISPSPSPSSYSTFHLPPVDLAPSLIANYFAYINLHFPLLHRPTFNQLVKQRGFLLNEDEGTKRREESTEGEGFAQVYLLVCALGAWYSDDPRCLLDAEPDSEREARIDQEQRRGMSGSAGWKWFNQVQLTRNRSLFTSPTLEDLQIYALSAQFLQASSAPQSSWTMAGIGIRLAQDVGIHRRNGVMSQAPTRDGELWKRAFWVLVCIDRTISCHLGRSCAIQDEDFDLDPPIDCDDEFWDADNPDPAMRFRQPSNKPSLVTHFLLYIELTHILTFSLRTVYSINKSTALCGLIGPEWEYAVVSELDSALNKWADSVPGYLKWDPHRENNDLLFNQSASLWATYYLIQILVHRPFIPSRKKTPSTTIPSLAICTNAARACCHVVDAQQRRTGAVIAQVQMAVFQSAVVLLLSIWGGKRSGLLIDGRRGMEDVHKCMNMLKMAEQRWHPIGKVWDLLYELTSVGDLPLPLPQPEANAQNKRARDTQGDQADVETDSIMFACPNFSKPRSPPFAAPSNSNAARPLANGLSNGTSRPWHATVNVDPNLSGFPTFDFTQTTPPVYSAEASASSVFSNVVPPVPYQGNQPEQGQQGRHASSFDAYPFASGIPEHPVETDVNGLSDTDLIDLWLNAPSGFQLDEWDTYLSSVSILTQQHSPGGLGEVAGMSYGYSV